MELYLNIKNVKVIQRDLSYTNTDRRVILNKILFTHWDYLVLL